jgi:hypothetical protein
MVHPGPSGHTHGATTPRSGSPYYYSKWQLRATRSSAFAGRLERNSKGPGSHSVDSTVTGAAAAAVRHPNPLRMMPSWERPSHCRLSTARPRCLLLEWASKHSGRACSGGQPGVWPRIHKRLGHDLDSRDHARRSPWKAPAESQELMLRAGSGEGVSDGAAH